MTNNISFRINLARTNDCGGGSKNISFTAGDQLFRLSRYMSNADKIGKQFANAVPASGATGSECETSKS